SGSAYAGEAGRAIMADLYQTTSQNITLHIKAIYGDGVLQEEATCKEYLQVLTEGTRRWKMSLKPNETLLSEVTK
ncbi:MAG: hypothetical protein KAR36_05675, partial [Candidatus Latescibacteria bacterium]|nr:hypothetical protein [Candidatus Latescibacterota bacterium]